jgi:hypothetical protein
MLLLTLATGCHLSQEAFDQDEHAEIPGIVHLGEIDVVTADDFLDPAIRDEVINYHVIGPPGAAVLGGASATFVGTGGSVCLIADPESVFWAESVAVQDADERYTWPDNFQDDGDIDLFAGLSAYYTGTPGLDLGDFNATYEDALGVEVEIEFNECTIADFYGSAGGNSGRAHVEYCSIDTSTHPGVEYTVVLQAFGIPLDDDLLTYGFAIVDTSCTSLAERVPLNECTIPGEARTHKEWTGSGDMGYDREAAPELDENGDMVLYELDGFRTMESYVCGAAEDDISGDAAGPASYCRENSNSRWCGDPT